MSFPFLTPQKHLIWLKGIFDQADKIKSLNLTLGTKY